MHRDALRIRIPVLSTRGSHNSNLPAPMKKAIRDRGQMRLRMATSATAKRREDRTLDGLLPTAKLAALCYAPRRIGCGQTMKSKEPHPYLESEDLPPAGVIGLRCDVARREPLWAKLGFDGGPGKRNVRRCEGARSI